MHTNKLRRTVPRFYRNWINADDLVKTQITIKDTDLLILTKAPPDLKFTKERIFCLRRDIEDYIAKDKNFATSLKPIPIELNAPPIIKLMAAAGKAAGVGPMAAVAGSIAQLLGQALSEKGQREVIIENGGDIYLGKQANNRLIGIFAGESKFSGKLNLLIKSNQTPCGVCASSATVGHSLSLGNADAAVILAQDAALADAVATATCNLVKTVKDLNVAIAFAQKINGVYGVLIVFRDKLACWGALEVN